MHTYVLIYMLPCTDNRGLSYTLNSITGVFDHLSAHLFNVAVYIHSLLKVPGKPAIYAKAFQSPLNAIP